MFFKIKMETLINERGAEVYIFRKWNKISGLYDKLKEKINWEQGIIKMFGKECKEARLSFVMTDDKTTHRYSGTTRTSHPWDDDILQIKKRLESEFEIPFNSCLLNYYPTGTHNIGYHSDKELSHINNYTVATVSLGGSRDFYFKDKENGANTIKTILHNDDLCIMTGSCQDHYTHSLPKRSNADGRISLTFRYLKE